MAEDAATGGKRAQGPRPILCFASAFDVTNVRGGHV